MTTTKTTSSAFDGSDNPTLHGHTISPKRVVIGVMEIRIIKRPPAPLMDGFDLRGLEVGRVYVVDQRLGRYLVAGGYGTPEKADQNDDPKQQ